MAAPVAASETSVEPPPDDVDVRHGVHDGLAWTLTSTLEEDSDGSSLCLDLSWDDVVEHWQSCYSLSYADMPMSWTNPTPPPYDGSRAMFVLGLTVRDAATVRVVRGDLVVGEGPVFPGGQLVPDRAGFALPLDIGVRESIVEPTVLPEGSPDVTVGLVEPLEVIAYDAEGVEVARGFSPISQPEPMICFFGPDPAPSPEWSCGPLVDELWPGLTTDDSLLWMTTPSAAASVDLLLDGTPVASQPTSEVPVPAGATPPAPRVVVFDIGVLGPWMYEVVARDATGAVVQAMDLGTWYGGGEGDGDVIPGSR